MSLTGACKYATYGNNAVWLNRILHIYTIMPNVPTCLRHIYNNIIHTIIQYMRIIVRKSIGAAYKCYVVAGAFIFMSTQDESL